MHSNHRCQIETAAVLNLHFPNDCRSKPIKLAPCTLTCRRTTIRTQVVRRSSDLGAISFKKPNHCRVAPHKRLSCPITAALLWRKAMLKVLQVIKVHTPSLQVLTLLQMTNRVCVAVVKATNHLFLPVQ